jgi:hypothetical protein
MLVLPSVGVLLSRFSSVVIFLWFLFLSVVFLTVTFMGYVVLLFASMFVVVSSVCLAYVLGGWASVCCGHVVSVLTVRLLTVFRLV